MSLICLDGLIRSFIDTFFIIRLFVAGRDLPDKAKVSSIFDQRKAHSRTIL